MTPPTPNYAPEAPELQNLNMSLEKSVSKKCPHGYFFTFCQNELLNFCSPGLEMGFGQI